MSWHFSQALVAAFSGERSSGGELSVPSSSIPTPAMCWLPGRTMDAFRPSRSGMTCEPLTADRGAELLTWCLAGSPAKTSPPPARAPGSAAPVLDSGERWHALLVKFDPASCGWKTARCLWEEVLDWSCLTLPRWGSLHDGELWERATPGLPTRERIWILAHATGQRSGAGLCQVEPEQDGDQPANGGGDVADAEGGESGEPTERQGREDSGRGSGDCGGTAGTGGEEVSDTEGRGRSMCWRSQGDGRHTLRGDLQTEGRERRRWWATEPDVGRVAHGVAARVDRLRCTGNGQVPAVVRLAWETLMGTSMHNKVL